jgi:hypothetical protein
LGVKKHSSLLFKKFLWIWAPGVAASASIFNSFIGNFLNPVFAEKKVCHSFEKKNNYNLHSGLFSSLLFVSF